MMKKNHMIFNTKFLDENVVMITCDDGRDDTTLKKSIVGFVKNKFSKEDRFSKGFLRINHNSKVNVRVKISRVRTKFAKEQLKLHTKLCKNIFLLQKDGFCGGTILKE